ncbi:MAG TPA: protein translocase subunit SecD [Chromatiales bacterium]|nr:protein translocase subunit SecD [Thiotrichales bacterium]HIP68099.1 protein translocase subunit SecD [Chromatiales bacterium]
MNRYPLWKYVLIIVVMLVGLVFAFPNLYPADPALQVSSSGSELITPDVQRQVEQVLMDKQLSYKSISLDEDKLLVRFDDTTVQLEAFGEVKEALGSRYVTALNLAPATPGWLRALGADPMYLGLDLRGGVHFLLEVDMKEALVKAADRYATDFRTALREARIRYLGVSRDGEGLLVKFKTEEERARALSALSKEMNTELVFEETQIGETLAIKAKVRDERIREIERFAVKQNMTALRKRVNELGVAEPIIQQQGKSRIVVQLPGVQDTARAKRILGATATLEFRMVDEEADALTAQSTGRVPAGDRLYKERGGRPILLKRRVMLTGEYIIDAASGIDPETQTPDVSITLDGKGARIFNKATTENVKRLMAVVFIETKPEGGKVEEVINVARIQEPLSKRFHITGLDSTREARDLALLLRAGALAAPMRFVEERTVGPSLGKANIEQGFKAVVLGFILVIIFMILFYRLFGILATVALTLNLVLIVAVLSMLQATLTLPGIAGIVLTVGMAVDANVLIFERIREELRAGNSPHASIDAGYDKALSTIADANITTLIAAIVLFAFGTGPIKGFAVTLSIGIVASMFTAIMVTRGLVNLIYGKKARLKSLAIGGGV